MGSSSENRIDRTRVWTAIVTTIGAVIVAFITTSLQTQGLSEQVGELEALPVGSIIPSMLTETQFNDLSEGKWVLADGRRVAGSTYARVTEKEEVPNLAGQFLRGLDSTGSIDPDGANRTTGDLQTHALQTHFHTETALAIEGDLFQHASDPQGVEGHGNQEDEKIYLERTTSPPIHMGGEELDRSSETRPTNVAVNFFIKIEP